MREINHILCPVDFSAVSKSGLAHAFAWAEWFGAEVHVLHVAPIPITVPGLPGVVVTLDSGSIARTHRELRDFVASACQSNHRYDFRVLHGDPGAVILEEAKRYLNVLVILGSRATHGFERIVLGSVSERVLHRTKVPTLVLPVSNVVPATTVTKLSRIVCGVNLHLSSLEALRYALSLSTEWDADLRVVSVLEPVDTGFEATMAGDVIGAQHEAREAAIRAIRQHVPDDAREACGIHEEVYSGDPVTTLLEVAQDGQAELLVVGAGDRPHLSALWRGHTTDRLVRQSTCPVLVVPTPPAVRRAASMAATPVARDEWKPILNQINNELAGHLTTVTLIDREMSAMPEVTALPLVGIVAQTGAHGEAIELILGDGEESHLTHVIDRPTQLRMERLWFNGVRLLIDDASGSETLVEVTGVPQPTSETLAAANPLF